MPRPSIRAVEAGRVLELCGLFRRAGSDAQNGPNQFRRRPREVHDRRELGIPGTGRVVQARFLDGNEPDWKPHVGARVTLAQWITSPDNPFFARAMVNRTWAEFFGTGLVDPVDDMGPHNLPSHPALLDELAQQFAAHDFDVKYLMRAIVLSRPYQLSQRLSRSDAKRSPAVRPHVSAGPDARSVARLRRASGRRRHAKQRQ